MKFSIKTFATVAACAALSLTVTSAVETDPVGYVTVTIEGTGGLSSEAYTFVSFPFVNPAESQGTSTAIGTSSLTDTDQTWTVDEFAEDYFIEITSGTAAGTATTILSNTADTLTLSDDLSLLGLLTGDSYVVRKYTTIADAFGSDQTEIESNGGVVSTSPATADLILIPNQSGGYDFYYFNSNASPVLGGWRSTTAPTTDASDTPLVPGTGFIYRRVASGNLDLVTAGSVQTQPNMVSAIESGFTFVGSNYPVEATLESFFGEDGTVAGLTGGTSPATADRIIVPNESGAYDFYYYNTNASPVLGGWRSTTAPTTDASDAVIAGAGKSFVIQRLGDAFNLDEVRPFNQ